jgi:hypothetical protein
MPPINPLRYSSDREPRRFPLALSQHPPLLAKISTFDVDHHTPNLDPHLYNTVVANLVILAGCSIVERLAISQSWTSGSGTLVWELR